MKKRLNNSLYVTPIRKPKNSGNKLLRINFDANLIAGKINRDFYRNLRLRGRTHAQIIRSIQPDRVEQFKKDVQSVADYMDRKPKTKAPKLSWWAKFKNKFILFFVLLSIGSIKAQVIQPEPNFGLAMSATGISVFTFGATIKPTLVVQQYNPRYGYNYVRYDSGQRQKIKSTTLIVGGAFTLIGIYLQNKKRKNGKVNIRI